MLIQHIYDGFCKVYSAKAVRATHVAVNAVSFQVEKPRIQSKQKNGSVTQNASHNNNVVELGR